MRAIPQSIAWWCFVPQHFAPEAFVRAVAEAGYAAIDLAPPEHCALVRAHGLAISALAGHGPLTHGLNRRAHHAEIEAQVRAALAVAQEYVVPNVLCFSGNRAGLDDAAGAAACAEGLARLAPLAEAAGVTLALEVLNSKVDHPDYQADHTAWAAAVCERVASPRVKVLDDLYHMQIMEGDLIRTLQTYAPLIAHYHTAGCPGRHELDETQEINYHAVLRAIRATGYQGYVVHEFLPLGDPLAALRATVARYAPDLA
ncbi:MAG: TIM barrel protein [Anaerolineales bacterium]|nr:TIM barrel protein [Anaerolineales bacterium]